MFGVVYNEQAISSRFQVYNNKLGSDMKWESLLISNGGIIFMFPPVHTKLNLWWEHNPTCLPLSLERARKDHFQADIS